MGNAGPTGYKLPPIADLAAMVRPASRCRGAYASTGTDRQPAPTDNRHRQATEDRHAGNREMRCNDGFANQCGPRRATLG